MVCAVRRHTAIQPTASLRHMDTRRLPRGRGRAPVWFVSCRRLGQHTSYSHTAYSLPQTCAAADGRGRALAWLVACAGGWVLGQHSSYSHTAYSLPQTCCRRSRACACVVRVGGCGIMVHTVIQPTGSTLHRSYSHTPGCGAGVVYTILVVYSKAHYYLWPKVKN